MLLSNDEFLKQLDDLFDARKTLGSVFITEKRYTFEAPSAPAASTTSGDEDTEITEASGSSAAAQEGAETEEDHKEYPALIRATDGKSKKCKVKISTLVQPGDYETFSLAYGTLLKGAMTSLRKKRKTKRKAPTGAAAAKGAAAKGTGSSFTPLTKVVGPRRGAGVEKRRRTQRRRAKEVARLVARRKRDGQN